METSAAVVLSLNGILSTWGIHRLVVPCRSNSGRRQYNYFPLKMVEMRSARSKIERCSSAPSTSRLSTSEKTMTILFFCASGIFSSKTIA